MVDYYDKIIVGIGGSVGVGVLLGVLTALEFHTGLFAGTILATAFVYDAMFRNPPLPVTHPAVGASAIVWHAVLVVLAAAVYAG